VHNWGIERKTRTILNVIVNKARSIMELDEEKLESKLSSKIAGKELSVLLIYCLIFMYTAVFSYFTIMKHYAFKSFAWDFGITLQALETTVHEGRFLYYTPELFFNLSGCYFGLHFSPILLLILPVYAICPKPEALLVLQSFIMALATIPLYWFTRDKLNSKLAAVGFSAVYLLFPPLHGANWFDFHVQCFLPLFFFSVLYYFEHEKWGRYFTFTVLALTIAENVPIVVIFVGLYGLLKYRREISQALRRKAFDEKKILIPPATITVGIVWLFLARWIQNTFFPVAQRFQEFYTAGYYWSVLGIKGDPIVMPIYMILNPAKVLEALTYDAYLKLLFLVLVFGSLFFLSLRSSIVLIAFAWLGPALLSNEQKFYVLGIHYPLYFIPFIFLAAVEGMKKQHLRKPNGLGRSIRNMLVVMMIFAVFASPISPLLLDPQVQIPHFSEYSLPRIGEHELALQRIVDMVPKNASVLTQNHIFSHFADRSNAYIYPLLQVFSYAPSETRDYADQLLMKSDYVLVDTKYDGETGRAILSDVQIRLYFYLVDLEDGVYLYERYR